MHACMHACLVRLLVPSCVYLLIVILQGLSLTLKLFQCQMSMASGSSLLPTLSDNSAESALNGKTSVTFMSNDPASAVIPRTSTEDGRSSIPTYRLSSYTVETAAPSQADLRMSVASGRMSRLGRRNSVAYVINLEDDRARSSARSRPPSECEQPMDFN